jgi:DNA helicase-2/ATP-dependent DNA helicase PcrA
MLTASSDKKGEDGSVSLMTMHASKGLEFKVVFMPCLVEGLMPHKRAVQEREGGLEEERRLCYVGMTRAQERLILSYYSKSFVKSYTKSAYKSAGNYATVMPSVFIGETSMLKHCKKGEVAYGKL